MQIQGQMDITQFMRSDTDEKVILPSQYEDAKELVEQIKKARQRAQGLIDDARKRYIKEKTRAKSKKLAEEKDAILASGRYDKLAEYDRREDIQEAYGWDIITERERDSLEALWDERERIKAKVVDGFYKDDVTEALHEAYSGLEEWRWPEQEEAEQLIKLFIKKKEKAERDWAEIDRARNDAYAQVMAACKGAKDEQ